jgi:hypothetical protein
VFHDDSDPPLPVLIVEIVNPDNNYAAPIDNSSEMKTVKVG